MKKNYYQEEFCYLTVFVILFVYTYEKINYLSVFLRFNNVGNKQVTA